MSDSSSKHLSIMDWLKSLIPGYSGYLKLENRRENDRRTRQYISERISDCKKLLHDHLKVYLDRAELDAIASGDKLRSGLDMLQKQVDSQIDGNSKWFTDQEANANTLDRLSELDASTISDIDRIAKYLADPTIPTTETLHIDIPKALEVCGELREKLERRAKILLGEIAGS